MAATEKDTLRAQPAEQHEWLGGNEPLSPKSAAPYPNGNGAHDEPPGLAALDARAPIGFRTPPNNIDAEQAVLGAVLVNNEAYARVSGFLRPTDFYEPVHGRIYAAISRLIDAGRVADHVTMAEQFDQDEALKELDGHKYLASLAHGAETILNAEDYGHLLHDLAIRRSVIALGEAAVNKAYDPTAPETPSQQLEDVRQQAEKLGQESLAGDRQQFDYIENDDITDILPLRDFLVERWVPVGCVTSLYGSGGTGKSFLALMIAMCVSAGRKWLGFGCRQAPVLALMCEDDEAEIRRRRNKIARALGISAEDVGDRLWITSRLGLPNAMMEFPSGVATRTPLFERIIQEAKQAQARLVILDNAAQLFGGNENDRAQVTAFLNACAGIATQTNGAVLLLGHPPKVPGVEFSGSTAWDAVVRSRIWFKRSDEDDDDFDQGAPARYTLELVKSNYEKCFGIELQENGNGIVEYVGELAKAKNQKPTSHDRILSAFRALFTTHRRAITQNEIAEECIRIGMWAENEVGSDARRKQLQRVREAMNAKRGGIDARDDGSYALKP